MSSTSAAAAAWRDPVLVVFAGRPGTGKSTTARLLASRLQAAYVRTDVIAGAVLSGGLTQDPGEAGSVAYVVARGVALENLSAGVPVVIDGVQATHDRRAVWRQLAQDDAELHRSHRRGDGGLACRRGTRVQGCEEQREYDHGDEGCK